MSYTLVTYDGGNGPRAAIVVNDRLIDAADATGERPLCDDAGHPRRLGRRRRAPARTRRRVNRQQRRRLDADSRADPAPGRDLLRRARTTPTTSRKWPLNRNASPNPTRTRWACSRGISSSRRTRVVGPNAVGEDSDALEQDRLGGRAGRGHRQSGDRRQRSRRAQLRRRIHRRQRPLGARLVLAPADGRRRRRSSPIGSPTRASTARVRSGRGSSPRATSATR